MTRHVPQGSRRPAAALAAGAIAIAVNTALLAAMAQAGLRTAHGGLLRLVQDAAVLPAMGGTAQAAFHVLVGLLMALGYGLVAEPVLPGPAWRKGLVAAAVVWLLNAAVVLPLIGEGFAGTAHLRPVGLLGFAFAHTVFFVLLAVLYRRLPGRGARSGRGGQERSMR